MNFCGMDQKSVYDMLEEDYTSAYLYDYPFSDEQEDYDIYTFNDMEVDQIIGPWDSIQDITDSFRLL